MERRFIVYAWGHAVIFGEAQEDDAREAFSSACMVASLNGDEPSEVIRAGEIMEGSDMEAFTRSAESHGVTVHRCDQGEPYPWDGEIDSDMITSAARALARMIAPQAPMPPARPTYQHGLTEPFNPYGQHGLN